MHNNAMVVIKEKKKGIRVVEMIYNGATLVALGEVIKELEDDLDVRIEIEFDDTIKCRIIKNIKNIKNIECIKEFNYPKLSLVRLVLDLQQYSHELEENDRMEKAKEVVKFLDDYARIRGWNCYFSNLETCKSSEILRAVLLSCKEKHPRLVSFYLGNSIETIKKQIEGIRLN